MGIRLDPQATTIRVLCAATGNLTLSGAQTVDGVPCVAGDLVWAQAQSTGAERAIYLVQDTAWILVDPGLSNGLQVLVRSGSTNGGKVYRITSNTTWGSGTPTIVEDSSAAGSVTADGVETLTNKTLTAPLLTNPVIGGQTAPSAGTDVVKLYSADQNGGATAGLGIVCEGGGKLLIREQSTSGDSKLACIDEAVADDANVNLPVLANGGIVFLAAGGQGGIAAIGSDASVTILSGTANLVTTDTDNKLCLLDLGSVAAIKNRLGTTQRVTAIVLGS